MLGLLYICLMFSERRDGMNITDEKFADVLKSLTQGDFDVVQNIVEQLITKFDDHETKSLFTENEIGTISKFIESNSQEVLIGVLVTKFKEDLCSQQILFQER